MVDSRNNYGTIGCSSGSCGVCACLPDGFLAVSSRDVLFISFFEISSYGALQAARPW